ncbi:hypothetical protein EI555_005764 [Monodon monoceros]|uniref:Exocyst complex component 2 n=1 Tax=Monodon monoceros TaxID=40151 RepID=A0A4U1ELR9_MONMO|nr:hypothetical protein EI555_005764 [Monodon monoceros]
MNKWRRPVGPPGLHSATLDLDGDVRASVPGHLGQTASLKRGSSFQPGRDDAWRYQTPHRVAFVEKLTKLVLSQLPNFWKLWISYVNGSLFSETAEKSGHIERSKNVRQRQNDFKKMIQEVMHCLVKLLRGALLPLSVTEGGGRQCRGWEVKAELSGQGLAHAIQTLRLTYESLTALEIPNDLLQTIQDLVLDLRVRCVVVTLQHTAEEVKRLAEKEDWVVDSEGLTSLPCHFERCVVHSLQSLREVLECKPGEASVFQQPKTQEEVCQLSINIMQVFICCLEQLSTKPDADVDTAHLSVDVSSPDLFGSIHEDFSLTSIWNQIQFLCFSPLDDTVLDLVQEQRLLIVLSNCCYLERHTFRNIAEHFEKHNFQGIEKITQVSVASLKELDQRLFENYIELKADPIVGSLEPGIYAGYFDWKDCLPPTVIDIIGRREDIYVIGDVSVRNYLKEALVNIIAVHAEVFTISKGLVPRVLSRLVEAVSEELSRLMQCVSSFSKNGALQARLEICTLRDTVAAHLTPESSPDDGFWKGPDLGSWVQLSTLTRVCSRLCVITMAQRPRKPVAASRS